MAKFCEGLFYEDVYGNGKKRFNVVHSLDATMRFCERIDRKTRTVELKSKNKRGRK